MITEQTYQANEFAHVAGVTVRTLHHYDRIGSQQDVFGSAKLAQLRRCMALENSLAIAALEE